MNDSYHMFEELGYKYYYSGIGEDIALKKDEYNLIYFHIEDREIEKDGEYFGIYSGITIPELKAIIKKCEELGWL